MSWKFGLLGSSGRMGTRVAHLLETDYAAEAHLLVRADRHNFLGDSLDQIVDALLSVDAVIDFSSPAAMSTLARKTLTSQKPLPVFVVGSTGWSPEEFAAIESLAQKTAVLVSSNFSTGILLLAEILKNASPLFRKLGYSPVIVETHHQHKKDAPSGTALLLQKAIAAGEEGRAIQSHSIRAGEIIGDHEITFFGTSDTLTLSHHAMDRSIFARGAIDVAKWLAKKRQSQPALKGLIEIESFLEDLKSN